MAKFGVAAAYRGYRLQALYTLSRILDPTTNKGLVFQPEGNEDLAVWAADGSLLEAVQVKSYSDLALSHLKPDEGKSFFVRVADLVLKTPQPKIKLVNFGTIGKELKSAWTNDQHYRQSVTEKLNKLGLDNQAVDNIFSSVELVEVEEQKIKDIVFGLLSESCTGADPESAFDLLSFWLYKISEDQARVQYADVIDKLNSVAQFLAESHAHHAEWYTSILPISDRVIDEEEMRKLQAEFYAGVGARYEHILADLDFIREGKWQEIRHAFGESNTVIVHAASGQGKTTLAYRYLHDCYPENWRFAIKLIQDRRHAMDILRALVGHARALQAPMAVYIDVSPRDTDWPDLVKGLAAYSQVQVLVTIREEDFRRANLEGNDFSYAEVELNFNQSEAQQIYTRAIEQGRATEFLDFDEAWGRFGGHGPLMEFVYLLTQTKTLRERLAGQINRVRDEINLKGRNQDERKLLHLVAIASCYEARIRVTRLAQILNIPDLPRTLELFEKEYLLRQSPDGVYVEGLHPIRSLILTDLLSDPVLSPWIGVATQVLPLIAESDLEGFILHALVHKESDSKLLLHEVAHLQTTTWTGTVAIFHCLMWSGVRDYIQANWPLIEEMYPQWGVSILWVLDLDFTHLATEAFDKILALLPAFTPNQGSEKLKEYRSRQTPISDVTAPLVEWLGKRLSPLDAPASESDWKGVAELLFWCGELDASKQLLEWISDSQLNEATAHQSIGLIADVALGLHTCSPDRHRRWLTTNHEVLYKRLAEEYGIVAIETDEQNLRIHFLPEIYNYQSVGIHDTTPNVKTGSEPIQERTVERIHLVRSIFPTHATYSSRGYSYTFGNLKLPYDFTLKEGIPIRSLPPIWAVRLNALARNMLLNRFRPGTWDDYVASVITLRDVSAKCFAYLQRGVVAYLQRDKAVDVKGKYLNKELWQQGLKLSYQPPLLPRCALDPWGLASEEDSKSSLDNAQKTSFFPKSIAIQKYSAFTKHLNNYCNFLYRFLTQACDVMDTNLCIGKLEPESPAWNLGVELLRENRVAVNRTYQTTEDIFLLCDVLITLTNDFRYLFGHIVSNDLLDQLDARENEAIKQTRE
jgi:hypothetical protein